MSKQDKAGGPAFPVLVDVHPGRREIRRRLSVLFISLVEGGSTVDRFRNNLRALVNQVKERK